MNIIDLYPTPLPPTPVGRGEAGRRKI